MKKLLAASVIYLAALLSAGAQSYPTNWYWQVADTSPTTQVWEGISGSFVSNTTANFNTWLTNVANAPGITGQGLAFKICGDVNNGSGAHRLTVCDPTIGFINWVTGQTKTVTGVGGTTGANGAWIITIISAINGTFDLQGSTFGGAYTSGGVAGTGYQTDTAVNLYGTINTYNLSVWFQNSASGSVVPQITASTILTNPLSSYYSVSMGAGAQIIRLPQANLFGSIPVGQSILFYNGGGVTWTLSVNNGTPIVVVPIGWSVYLTLINNNNQIGSWSYVLLPNTAGVTCGAGLGGTSRTTSGLVTTC